MKDLNEVILTGRMTRDPELTRTRNEIAKCAFSIAVNRGKDKEGKDKGAFFFRCQTWKGTAEITAKFGAKGRRVIIRGQLFASEYEKDGQKKTYTGIDVDTIIFADERRREAADVDPGREPGDDGLPF